MTPTILSRRLAALEATRIASPVRFSPEEVQEAARRYEAFLDEPSDPDPRRDAYLANRTLKEIAADWDESVRTGRYAPWLWETP
jgi:O-succinylbenzoate synthase